jgi:sodium-dependent phosphate cotransporter
MTIPTDRGPLGGSKRTISGVGKTAVKVVLVLTALYVFLVSVTMMGSGFKTFGKGFAEALISGTSNPFVGLFIGVLATAIIQSSSTTTSMVVAFVASGTLTVENAIPVVMGANVGTTVTAALVSMGHVTRRHEFQRAYQASTVHDLFNLCAVIVLLPVELATGYLHKSASYLSEMLWGSSTGVTFDSPLKMVTKPPGEAVKSLVVDTLGFSKTIAGTVLVVLGVIILIISLYALTKLMRSLVLDKLKRFFERSIGRSAVLGLFIGLVITAVIQSSSVTTSLMVPMAAAGVMRIRQIFPVTVGANVGTTVTAILASLTGNPTGLTIALVHLLFNLSGILVFFVPPPMRRIPLFFSRKLAEAAGRRRYVAAVFILTVFFVLPGLMIFFTKTF